MSEMMDIVKQVNENVAQHIEEFAAAFAKRTGLDPTKIKMVSSIRGYRHEVWFEPFPSITEIEQYRKRAELAEAELARRDEELALTEKKLCNIDRSARAEIDRLNAEIKTTDDLLKEATDNNKRSKWKAYVPGWGAPAVNKRYLVKLINDWITIATYYLRVGGGYWKDDRGQELADGVVSLWKGLEE